MIYFIAPTSPEPFPIHKEASISEPVVKIGSSWNPIKRLQILRGKFRRQDLEIIGVMPGGVILERQLHREFHHNRAIYHLGPRGQRKRGRCQQAEWFYQADDLMEYIRLNATQNVPTHGQAVIEFRTTEKFAMSLEYAAIGRNVSVNEYIELVLKEKFKQSRLYTYPYRQTD